MNEKFRELFTIEEKAAMFDEISKHYYDGNFGSFSKSQIDLLMFSLYLEKLIDKNWDYDDYTISKQLGIVQSSVRQLKKKKQLIYPRNYKWYEAFLKYGENAVIDHQGRIVISIPDPNVYIELQYAIEKIGGYVDVQLNPKLLKIPAGYYLELLLEIHKIDGELDKDSEKNFKKSFIKKLNERYSENEKVVEEFTEKNLTTKLKEGGLKIALDLLAEMLPGGNIIASGVSVIAKNLFL